MTGAFTIPGRLVGLNEIVGIARFNRYAGASQKKSETRRCAFAIMTGQVPTFKVPITICFRWIEQNLKRDPDNICAGAKFVLDALVELQRIPNDTRKWIKGIDHEFPDPDKNDPRIEVTITEATCPC